MAGCGFPREARLLQKSDYSRVFKQARRSADRNFTVLARRIPGNRARLGLAISKKIARHAVQRNRLKRLIRESFRHNQDALQGLDLVVMGRPGVVERNNEALTASLHRHWNTVIKRCADL